MITAMPNRRQKLYRTLRHVAVRTLIAAGLLALASAVLLTRSARVLVNLAATGLAKAEFKASEMAGTPPLGAVAGLRLAEAFWDEFRDAHTTTDAAA